MENGAANYQPNQEAGYQLRRGMLTEVVSRQPQQQYKRCYNQRGKTRDYD